MKRKGDSGYQGSRSRPKKRMRGSQHSYQITSRSLPPIPGVEGFGRQATRRYNEEISNSVAARVARTVGGADFVPAKRLYDTVSAVSNVVGKYGRLGTYILPQKKEMGKSTSIRVQKKLVSRSAMAVSGKNKVKKTKTVKVPKLLKKQIKQVLSGQTARGSFTTVISGFVGSITTAAAGVLAGDDLGKLQTQVINNATAGLGGRTLFNQLVNYIPLAASGIVPNAGLNFFTPGKILNAASVLFNNKPVGGVYTTAGNLSTFALSTTGVPPTVTPQVGQLKVNVLDSKVMFTMKNVSNRVVTVEIWECTPTIKFSDSNPLQNLVTTVQTFSEAAVDTNFQYILGGANNSNGFFDPTFDPCSVAKQYMGFKYTWKKRSMVLAPDETCIHQIQGPKGVFDFTKINNVVPIGGPPANNAQATETLNCLMKGWSVGCIISVHGDYVLPLAASNGGRYVYTTTVGALGMPIAVEVQERYNIAVPEVAGFITTAGAAGTQQMLNMRKSKKIVWNAQSPGTLAYQVSNEVNPIAEAPAGQNQ